MSMDNERRSGCDRRKQIGLNMRTFAGNGKRITIRRQEDKDRIFFADQYGPVIFFTMVGMLFLCVMDAILTLYLLKHGASAMNTLSSLLLNKGPHAFLLSKYALTMVAAFFLFLFRCVVAQKWNLSTHTILYFLAWGYAAVVGWELYLVYHVS